MTDRRTLLLGLPGLALTGCGVGDGGIGGTGDRAAGPVRPAPPTPTPTTPRDEGGVGGTGIFGALTGVGPIVLNGLRIGTDAATAFDLVGLGGAPLAPGDTVAVVATAGLVARRVALFQPLVGPIGRDGAGRLTVAGTPVRLPAGVPIRDPAGVPVGPEALRPGRIVAVAGLWNDRQVVATGLRLRDGAPVVELRGLLRRDAAGARIGATRLPDPGGAEGFVAVVGRPDAGRVAIDAVAPQPRAVFADLVTALAVEGFLARDPDGDGVHLAGFGLPFDPASPVVPRTGARRLFLGRVDIAFRIADAVALPEDAAARAALLDAPDATARLAAWRARG